MAERHLALACLLLAAAGGVRAADAPPVTAADRAAAFPELPGGMHGHMDDDPVIVALQAEELEWQHAGGADAVAWDVTGRAGRDTGRLWLRDEGRREEGGRTENRLELLWGRPVAAWWDLLAGARLDTGEGPARAYAALGVQGTAPQWIHVDATAYLGDGMRAGLRLEARYELLFTNRVVLEARGEAEAWSDDDAANGSGAGLGEVSAGLRLRWEWRRRLAPYVGVEWAGLAGDSADFARAAGEDVRDTRLVAGLRAGF